jgi:hypothetical protein
MIKTTPYQIAIILEHLCYILKSGLKNRDCRKQ